MTFSKEFNNSISMSERYRALTAIKRDILAKCHLSVEQSRDVLIKIIENAVPLP